MTPEELGRMLDAYRDGTLGAEDAAALAGALRAGGEEAKRIRRELELAGQLARVFEGADDADFLRSFEERMRAEAGQSQFIRAFEARSAAGTEGRPRRPRLSRRLWTASSPAPWIGAAAAALIGFGMVLLLGRAPSRPATHAPPEGAARDVAARPEEATPHPVRPPLPRPAPAAPTGAAEPDVPPVPPAEPAPPEEGPTPPTAPPPPRPVPVPPVSAPAVARVEETPAPPVPTPEPPPTVARPRATETAVAILEQFQGRIVVTGAGGELPVRPRMPLMTGHTLLVIGPGAADIRFPDGTRVEVQRDATVVFPAKPGASARLEVTEGRILADVVRQPAGKPFVFATAEAEAVVLGTRLAVTAIPGLTRLDVYQGRVRLDRRQDGASAMVGPGQYAIAAKGRPIEAIGPAPAVPRRPRTAAVTGFTLINADTDQPVPGFDPLIDGAVLHLNRLPTRNLNVRANTAPAEVGSVQFALDGRPFKNAEWRVPYALYGDSVKGDYAAWEPSPGEHVLTATPYEKPDAKGEAGLPHTITFYVIDRDR